MSAQAILDENAIRRVQQEALSSINECSDLSALEKLRIHYLGKKGIIPSLLSQLKTLPNDKRSSMGSHINTCKQQVNQTITEQKKHLEKKHLEEQLANEIIDVTLPARQNRYGSLHPITHITQRICNIFETVGYSIVEGPEVEDDFHNFEALNIPENHPAKAMHDTFYLNNLPYLLRTHTSPVQIRVMQATQPPIQIICPGKVYRKDSDLTHTPMFHQLEGLVVDQNLGLPQLKSTIDSFLSAFFDRSLKTRYRTSYFPFTEPSAEVDVQCMNCIDYPANKECRICSSTGWIEVMGCGMVHPNVLTHVNIDPSQFSGFAFGFGIDRLTMLYYGIPDLRLLFENQLDFITQFKHG